MRDTILLISFVVLLAALMWPKRTPKLNITTASITRDVPVGLDKVTLSRGAANELMPNPFNTGVAFDTQERLTIYAIGGKRVTKEEFKREFPLLLKD